MSDGKRGSDAVKGLQSDACQSHQTLPRVSQFLQTAECMHGYIVLNIHANLQVFKGYIARQYYNKTPDRYGVKGLGQIVL